MCCIVTYFVVQYYARDLHYIEKLEIVLSKLVPNTIISFLLRIVAPRRRIHALALVHARARIAVSDCCRYSMAQEEAATTESSVIGPLQMLDSCTTATQAKGWGGIGKRQVHRCSSAANALRPVQAPSALGA